MSGHSHFATIKRQKGLKDAAKGNIFSKLSKAISIAIKSGGSTNPDMNFKLRVAIDKAREFNMPKENIDRILKSAEEKLDSIEEITYEGFGPFGIFVVVETATDNKNRTAQEIKTLFEKNGGAMGGPNSVLHNFEHKGFLLVENVEDPEDPLEVFVQPDQLSIEKKKIEEAGFTVIKSELTMVAKIYLEVTDDDQIEKLTNFIENFESHDDVQKVFHNF
ncbi:MAG: YebC/PmpR family DNA-binding transcriptional regulator [Candidatus Woesebacteria bacterium]|nr:YebC/PmpR family DNA-binding transcriptional regulator [Candidatus Woesebacteria bacterium]